MWRQGSWRSRATCSPSLSPPERTSAARLATRLPACPSWRTVHTVMTAVMAADCLCCYLIAIFRAVLAAATASRQACHAEQRLHRGHFECGIEAMTSEDAHYALLGRLLCWLRTHYCR